MTIILFEKKDIILKRYIAFNLNFSKNINYITQIIVNKIFETSVNSKIIANLSTIQHFFVNCKLIYKYYNNYLKYWTWSKEVLPLHRENIPFMSFDNSFLKLINILYTSNLGFKLISIIQLYKKGWNLARNKQSTISDFI